MRNNNGKYEVKLSCFNCGRQAVYNVPTRHCIEEFDPEDRTPSIYYIPGQEDYRHTLFCLNCRLPHLRVEQWDSEQAITYPRQEGQQ